MKRPAPRGGWGAGRALKLRRRLICRGDIVPPQHSERGAGWRMLVTLSHGNPGDCRIRRRRDVRPERRVRAWRGVANSCTGPLCLQHRVGPRRLRGLSHVPNFHGRLIGDQIRVITMEHGCGSHVSCRTPTHRSRSRKSASPRRASAPNEQDQNGIDAESLSPAVHLVPH